mgnify:CR=1 FL=1
MKGAAVVCVALVSRFLLGEPIERRQVVGFVLLVAGMLRHCEIGLEPDGEVLNSRVKRDRPNSPETPLIR